MKKISIANGTYTDRDGQQKTRWVKVGVIGVSQNGKEYVLLDPTVNLAAFAREDGKDMVMCTVYDDSQQNNGGGYAPNQGYAPPPPQQGGYTPPPQQGGYNPPPQPVYEHRDANGNLVPPPNQQQGYPQQ